MADLKAAIRAQALSLGFDAVNFTKADLAPDIAVNFEAYIAAGYHGEMDWLARDPDRRVNPQGLWHDARSVIVLGTNYGPADDPLTTTRQSDRGAISVYARNNDYHDIIKRRLKTLGRWLHAETGAELKVFVDTAPVLEKPLAQQAGLGWQGKHTNLVSRDFGSWLFLAEIFTTVELEPDRHEIDHCGSCRNCLDACPTNAFPEPYRLDPRRCISYLTIEHKGSIPEEFRVAIGNRIYGCDDCLSVCPWNKFAQQTAEIAFEPREALTAPRLAELAELDDAAFRDLFSGSPIRRIGRERFIRNVLIAIGNSDEPVLRASAERHLTDPSPIIRDTAQWAVTRLEE